MTDYLEEHLGSAEALLERIRQLEQSVSGLAGEAIPKKNTDKSDDFSEKTLDTEKNREAVSKKEKIVYDIDQDVNQLKETVDSLDMDLEIRGKEQDIPVNRQIKSDDNRKNPGQTDTAHEAEGTGTQTNAERTENRSPLSGQLEELDRAVSAMAALTPAGQENSAYPISLSTPRGTVAGPTIPGVPGEVWSVPGEVWSVPGIPAGSDPAYGGEQNWAELADRMFRRDSRRYDGGFYLY